MEMKERWCKCCAKGFAPKSISDLYCSDQCSTARSKVTCSVCNKRFIPLKAAGKRSQAKMKCSDCASNGSMYKFMVPKPVANKPIANKLVVEKSVFPKSVKPAIKPIVTKAAAATTVKPTAKGAVTPPVKKAKHVF